MHIQSTDFELFDLQPRFAQDPATVDARWKQLQQQIHPDRFATHGAAAQRVAMQWSARVNEAYRRLKSPLRRAAYLCELNGSAINAEDNTAMPADFLTQQMLWRESLDDADNLEDLQQLEREVAAEAAARLERVQRHIDSEHDFAAAVSQVRGLMFLERISDAIADRLDRFTN